MKSREIKTTWRLVTPLFGGGAQPVWLWSTALPVAGAVGTITAAGASVASVAGGLAGAADYVTREG